MSMRGEILRIRPFRPFVEWYMLDSALGHASWLSVLTELRAIVQVRIPLAGAPEGTALPTQPATADSLLQWLAT